MPYLYINDFENGLDTRRSVFSAPAGSLRELHNCHITSGKEIERRKRFDSVGQYYAASTYGNPQVYTLPADVVSDGDTIGVIKGNAKTFANVVGQASQRLLATSFDPPWPSAFPVSAPVGGEPSNEDSEVRCLSACWFNKRMYAVLKYRNGVLAHVCSDPIGRPQSQYLWPVPLMENIAEANFSASNIAEYLAFELEDTGLFDSVRWASGASGIIDPTIRLVLRPGDSLSNLNVVNMNAGGTVDLADSIYTPPVAASPGQGALLKFAVFANQPASGVVSNIGFQTPGGDPVYFFPGEPSVGQTATSQQIAQFYADHINSSWPTMTATVQFSATYSTWETRVRLPAGEGMASAVGLRTVTNDVQITREQGADASAGSPGRFELSIKATVASRSDLYFVEGSVNNAAGSTPFRAAIIGRYAGTPRYVATAFGRMFAMGADGILYGTGFSYPSGGTAAEALYDPIGWVNGAYQVPGGGGAGRTVIDSLALDIKSLDASIGRLTTVCEYLGQLAVFGEDGIQVWTMADDPAAVRNVRVMKGVGCVAPRSVVDTGSDILFLDRSGVRSLRARDSSNTAATTDIGSPVDNAVTAAMASEGKPRVRAASAAVDRDTGRYVLLLGRTMYALSRFPASSVSAWSTYDDVEFLAAGQSLFTEEQLTRSYRIMEFEGGLVLTKAYGMALYGGFNRDKYSGYVSNATLAFADMGRPMTSKQLKSVDVGAEGGWTLRFRTRPDEALSKVGFVSGPTYFDGRIGAEANFTHIQLVLETDAEVGAAVVSSVALMFDAEQEDSDGKN